MWFQISGQPMQPEISKYIKCAPASKTPWTSINQPEPGWKFKVAFEEGIVCELDLCLVWLNIPARDGFKRRC